MKILFNKHLILLLFSIISIIGSFLYINNLKDDNIYIQQISMNKSKINDLKLQILSLSKYKNSEINDLRTSYNNLKLNFYQLFKKMNFIDDVNIKLSGESDDFEENIYSSENNEVIKVIDFNIILTLNNNNDNFYKYYKPLIYIYKFSKNKPIIIKEINIVKNEIIIKGEIYGK